MFAGVRSCPWCAEEIKSQAIVCKHCGRDVVPAQAGRAVPRPAPAFSFPQRVGLSSRHLGMAAFFLATLLFGLWGVKHHAHFSVSNVTFFLLMPIGPLVIGFVLMLVLIPKNRDPLEPSWLIFFVVVCAAVFACDQFFAYLHDGRGVGFFAWYTDLVQNRPMSVGVRARVGGTVDRVGEFGFVLELVKLGGILWAGISVYRDDRKLKSSRGSVAA